MYNDLITIGSLTIHGYGLMIAIGVLAALFTSEYQAKKKGLPSDLLYTMTVICVVFGFFCAKILYIIVEWKDFIQDPLSFLTLNGFVVYGGVAGGVFIAWVYLTKLKKQPFWEYFDIVLPGVALAQAFGRIGCFLAGCCYGRETEAWYGIAFTNSNFAPNGVKLIPTQLISSAGMFLIAAVCYLFARKNNKPGRVGALYMILYAIGRSLVEELRADKRGAVGPLSTSQFISIFIVILGLVLFFTRKERETKD